MRIDIRHRIEMTLTPPANGLVGTLHITPRDHQGQYVSKWRIDLEGNARLVAGRDAFGNTIHGYSLDGPLESLTIVAIGEVELDDMIGVVKNSSERLPPAVFLRSSADSEASEKDRARAAGFDPHATAPLTIAHTLVQAIHDERTDILAASQPEDPVELTRTTSSPYRDGTEELARAMIATTRLLRIPSRMVSGYALDPDTGVGHAHLWAECWFDGYGWVAFDPFIGRCPGDGHVRLAAGVDALSVALNRAAARGYGTMTTSHHVTVVPTLD